MPVANFVPSEPDELLFSWICRMAEANAISARKFSACFLSHSDMKHSLPRVRYDSCSQMWGLFTEFSPFFSQYAHAEEPISFFLSHSMYGALAPFLPEAEQQRLLSIMFGSFFDRGNRWLMQGRMLKICPKCRQEQGIRYFRIHQLPWVTVCPRHGCRLLKYTDIKGNEFSEDASFSMIESLLPNSELEERYACFYASFINKAIDCSYEDTECAIHKKLREMNFRPSASRTFNKWLKDSYGYTKKDFHLYRNQIVYSANPSKTIIPRYQLMILVFLLFESPEEFQSYLPTRKVLMRKFALKIKQQDLELLSQYRKILVFLEDKEGRFYERQKFICTASSLVYGENSTNK